MSNGRLKSVQFKNQIATKRFFEMTRLEKIGVFKKNTGCTISRSLFGHGCCYCFGLFSWLVGASDPNKLWRRFTKPYSHPDSCLSCCLRDEPTESASMGHFYAVQIYRRDRMNRTKSTCASSCASSYGAIRMVDVQWLVKHYWDQAGVADMKGPWYYGIELLGELKF